MRIPLFKELFGTVDEDTTRGPREEQCCEDDTPVDVLFQGQDCVQWSRRGVRRSSKHPANIGPTIQSNQINKEANGRRFSINESSSEDSGDSDHSEDSDCCYTALTQRQRSAHDVMIQKYRGKTFKDVEDDNSTCYEGLVVDVVFEKATKTLCFSFQNPKLTKRVSLDYIVTDYAINECEWVDLDEEDQSDETIVTAVKHKFVEWEMLGENESRKRVVYSMNKKIRRH